MIDFLRVNLIQTINKDSQLCAVATQICKSHVQNPLLTHEPNCERNFFIKLYFGLFFFMAFGHNKARAQNRINFYDLARIHEYTRYTPYQMANFKAFAEPRVLPGLVGSSWMDQPFYGEFYAPIHAGMWIQKTTARTDLLIKEKYFYDVQGYLIESQFEINRAQKTVKKIKNTFTYNFSKSIVVTVSNVFGHVDTLGIYQYDSARRLVRADWKDTQNLGGVHLAFYYDYEGLFLKKVSRRILCPLDKLRRGQLEDLCYFDKTSVSLKRVVMQSGPTPHCTGPDTGYGGQVTDIVGAFWSLDSTKSNFFSSETCYSNALELVEATQYQQFFNSTLKNRKISRFYFKSDATHLRVVFSTVQFGGTFFFRSTSTDYSYDANRPMRVVIGSARKTDTGFVYFEKKLPVKIVFPHRTEVISYHKYNP